MNNNLLKSLAVALIIGVTAPIASAASYYFDFDTEVNKKQWFGVKVNSQNPYTGEFNLMDNGGDSLPDIWLPLLTGNTFDDGYNPDTEMLTAAWAVFSLSDDLDRRRDEVVEIFLGSGSSLFDTFEVGFFDLTLGGVGGSALMELSDNGKINYTISAKEGDFMFRSAGIKATFETRPVPDSGSALALLGASLVGLIAVRRRATR